MESLFNTFMIYSSLKLQIDNPLGVLLVFVNDYYKTDWDGLYNI
jgi:hypothetical protein